MNSRGRVGVEPASTMFERHAGNARAESRPDVEAGGDKTATGEAGGGSAAPDVDLDRRRLAVVAAQANSLRWQIVATALVVASVLWRLVPTPLLAGWFVLVFGVRELRARQLRVLAKDENSPPEPLLHQVVLWNVALGAVNGAAALFLSWLDTSYAAVLTMILVSWAAGAVATSAPLLRAYVAYSACVFAPLISMWLLRGSSLGVGVAMLIAMFAGVQYRFAKQNAIVFEESFRIRRENDKLLQELAAARDAAEAANLAKSRFLAIASHDLRQPLHALTLHSSLLAMEPGASDAAAIAQEISTSIDALGRLLDSLLDISKLDAGAVVAAPRPIRLQRLLALLAQSHSPHARAKGIALRFECPPEVVVETDPQLLERLLRNLLDNAIKYTTQGEVSVTVEGSDPLEIEVRDTGRGIPREMQQRVFEEFFQVNTSDQARGLGLGLAIVQRLVRILDLPMSLSSEPGQGTRVRLRIARGRTPAPAPQHHDIGSGALAGRRVLLVDDDASPRRAMRRVLDRMGCETSEASSADEAIAAASTNPPDIVLADFRLGEGEDGIELIRRLRRMQPTLPALLLSGDTDTPLLHAADAAALPLLHKPVSLVQLHAAICTALEEPQHAASTREVR